VGAGMENTMSTFWRWRRGCVAWGPLIDFMVLSNDVLFVSFETLWFNQWPSMINEQIICGGRWRHTGLGSSSHNVLRGVVLCWSEVGLFVGDTKQT
jgi:hypothetical protein